MNARSVQSYVDRVERFRLTLRFFDDVINFVQFRLQIFRRRVEIFIHFFLCCFYFLLKGHVIFSSVFRERELS